MKNVLYLFYFLLIIFFSCKKEDKFSLYYGPVTVTQNFAASSASVNFYSGDKIYFTAAFEQNALWTIQLVGQTSGAVKTLTGSGKELNASNSIWDGTADKIPVFKLENVLATLSLQGDDNTYTATINITGTKNLDASAVLISDFKNNVSPIGSAAGWPSDWPLSAITSTLPSPDGNSYMFIQGYPWQGPNYGSAPPISQYVDYLLIPALKANGGYGNYYPLSPYPQRIYFNIMVYNTGTPSRLLVIFEEGDGTAHNLTIQPSGWPLHTWKLISIPYDQIAGTQAASHRIANVRFVLLSNITDQNILNLGANGNPGNKATVVSTIFDHPVFTLDKPWMP